MNAGTWAEYRAELRALRRIKKRVEAALEALACLALFAAIGVMLAWRG